MLLFLFWAATLWAANPPDVTVELRLRGDARAFHAGEPIRLELALSSTSDQKYSGRVEDPRIGCDEPPEVTPTDGLVNLADFDRMCVFSGGMSGLPLRAGERRLEHVDLSDWFRFTRPGHYSVRMKSHSMMRIKSADEGGGYEDFIFESNPIEFDILPFDQAWATAEQARLEETLRTHPRDSQEWQAALRALANLDTPVSATHLVEMYLGTGGKPPEPQALWTLRESTQLDVIIPILQAALANSAIPAPDNMPYLIAELETRRELGPIPSYQNDPEKEKAREARIEQGYKVHRKYYEQANQVLLATLEHRAGPQGALAIYDAWFNNEIRNNADAPVPESLLRLRASVLAVANELPIDKQRQLAVVGWERLPHAQAQLRPLIQRLGREALARSDFFLAGGVELWCKADPEECSRAVVNRFLEGADTVEGSALLALPEAERAELDEVLEQRLRDPKMMTFDPSSGRTAVLVLRAGSRKLKPQVLELLAKTPADASLPCDQIGDLFGYLFRIDAKLAAKRLRGELQQSTRYCGGEILRTLHNRHYSEDELPAALAALDAPDMHTAGTAALFLMEHAPATEQDALWRRLERLQTAWRDRSSELKPTGPNYGNSVQYEVVNFEEALASALINSKNWKLSEADTARLRQSCLAEECRNVTDGKQSLGL